MSPTSLLVFATLLAAPMLQFSAAATPAWVSDWEVNVHTISRSVTGVEDLEESAEAFTSSMNAAIASGTSDAELTKLLMDFLVLLDDDPRFQGFVASNTTASTSSGGSGSTDDRGNSAASGSNGATRVFTGLAAVLAVVVSTIAALEA